MPIELRRVTKAEALVAPLGAVARQIGEPDFHRTLLELVGVMLPHETSWIVRYPASDEPDVLYTKDISSSIVDVQAVADSIVVLRLGRTNGVFDADQVSYEDLIAAMTGATPVGRRTRPARREENIT